MKNYKVICDVLHINGRIYRNGDVIKGTHLNTEQIKTQVAIKTIELVDNSNNTQSNNQPTDNKDGK